MGNDQLYFFKTCIKICIRDIRKHWWLVYIIPLVTVTWISDLTMQEFFTENGNNLALLNTTTT